MTLTSFPLQIGQSTNVESSNMPLDYLLNQSETVPQRFNLQRLRFNVVQNLYLKICKPHDLWKYKSRWRSGSSTQLLFRRFQVEIKHRVRIFFWRKILCPFRSVWVLDFLMASSTRPWRWGCCSTDHQINWPRLMETIDSPPELWPTYVIELFAFLLRHCMWLTPICG